MTDHTVTEKVCELKHSRVDEIMDEIKGTQTAQNLRIDGLATEVQGMAKEVARLSGRIDELPAELTKAIATAVQHRSKTEWTPKGIVAMVVKLWPYILAMLAAAGIGYGISPTAPAAPAPTSQTTSTG